MPAGTAEQRERQAEMQGLLCGVVQARARRPPPPPRPRPPARAACARLPPLALQPSSPPPTPCPPPTHPPIHPPQTLCTRLAKEDSGKAALLQYADGAMEGLLRVLACPRQGSGTANTASVHEEAMQARARPPPLPSQRRRPRRRPICGSMLGTPSPPTPTLPDPPTAPQAVGAVAIGVGPQFSKYMGAFYPYLKAGLVNHAEWQVGGRGSGGGRCKSRSSRRRGGGGGGALAPRLANAGRGRGRWRRLTVIPPPCPPARPAPPPAPPPKVCLTTVGVLTDVADAVGGELAPYCDEIMNMCARRAPLHLPPPPPQPRPRHAYTHTVHTHTRTRTRTHTHTTPPPPRPPRLIHNLGSPDVHRSIKPQILSTFGDLALTLGPGFDKYVDAVKGMLQQAMSLSAAQARAPPPTPPPRAARCPFPRGNASDAVGCAHRPPPPPRPAPPRPAPPRPPPPAPPAPPQGPQAALDDDLADYNNELRMGILEAYSGLFQARPCGGGPPVMQPALPPAAGPGAPRRAACNAARGPSLRRANPRPVPPPPCPPPGPARQRVGGAPQARRALHPRLCQQHSARPGAARRGSRARAGGARRTRARAGGGGRARAGPRRRAAGVRSRPPRHRPHPQHPHPLPQPQPRP